MPKTWQEERDAEINPEGVITGPVHHHKTVPSHERPTTSEIMASVVIRVEANFPEPDFCVKDPSHDY